MWDSKVPVKYGHLPLGENRKGGKTSNLEII